MNVPDELVSILRDFSNINSSIIIYPGNTVRTVSEDKDIVAEYSSENEFNEAISIYDLPRFLNTMKILGPNPELQIDGNMIMLSGSGGQSIRYGMTPESMISPSMSRGVGGFDSILIVELTHDDIRRVRTAASALGVEHMTIRKDSDGVAVRVHQLSSSTSNQTDDYYDFVIQGSPSWESDGVEFVFDIKSLPSYEGDYKVSLSDDVISMFQNASLQLTYWVSMLEVNGYEG